MKSFPSAWTSEEAENEDKGRQSALRICEECPFSGLTPRNLNLKLTLPPGHTCLIQEWTGNELDAQILSADNRKDPGMLALGRTDGSTQERETQALLSQTPGLP